MQPDDLYGLPPERFVAERGALAKALRGEGRRDEAAEVATLRKPSAAAWVVNQLVRSCGEAVDELWAAGDAVREAQSDLLAGRGDARALREAGARVRGAVDELVDRAGGLGEELTPVTLVRVAETLNAAALDEEARAAVRDGRLERELRHAGLGLGLGEGAAVAAAPASAPARAPAKPAKRDAAAKERAAAEKAERAEREAARKQARAAAAEAAKREERAGHALRAAEERRERAATALADADAALEAAQAKAHEAAEEHRRARAAVDGG